MNTNQKLPQTFLELQETIAQAKARHVMAEFCGAPPTTTGPTPSGSEPGKDSLELPPKVVPSRIYVLGPMRGIDQYNFPAFYEMAERLRNAGYEAVNPAELDRQDGFKIESLPKDHDFTKYPEGMNAEDVVRRDLKAIMGCAGYVALPGYEKSKGATAEKSVFDWRCAKRLAPFSATTFVQIPNDTKPVPSSNPKDIAGTKKPPLRLLPTIALLYLSRAMSLGAKKYGEFNWRAAKIRATVYDEAALRHIFALLDGQDTDEESGLPHEAHVMACMAIKLDAAAVGTLIDDRNKSGKVPELIKQLTEKNDVQVAAK
jgi:hypothetical protein